MAVLVDTNILLRLLQPHHPHCFMAERAISVLHGRNEVLTISARNLVEFWAAVTRPVAENGLGFTIEQAAEEVSALKRLFVLSPEAPLLREWERIVTSYHVSGKNTHDARLVAAMIVHGISGILTFNVPDFTRYTEITVIDPKALS
jgi:predicted nucleic acid-binding protein